MYYSMMMCLGFLYHPPIVLTRIASPSQSFSADSALRDMRDSDKTNLGLSQTDIEELVEVSQAAIGDDDIRKLEEVMMTMTEEELETMTSMSDGDLENFYDEKLRKLNQRKESTNEDGRDVYFRVGEELVELKGLSDEDMESIMSSSDKLITKEELDNLKQFTSGISEEDLDFISDMTDEELERFYEDNIATKSQRHKREINEDDFGTNSELTEFEEDSLRISQSKVKREANPEPEPEPEPMGPQKESDFDNKRSNTEDKEQRFLEEYVRRFR